MGKAIIITTGGGTDTSEGSPNVNTSFILSGYTIYDREGEKRTGTLQTKTLSKTLNPGENVTIPAGYYNGASTNAVSAVALSSKTGATADSGHILKDKTGWRNGTKYTGSMASIGTRNGTLSANGTFTIPTGWHNGSGKVTQTLSTQAATSVTPGTAQKTVIAASKWTTGAQTVLGNGNLVAGNIKKDVTIFGVKGTFFIDTSDFTGNGVYLIKNGDLMMNPKVTFTKDVGEYAASRDWIAERARVAPVKVGNDLVITLAGYDYITNASNGYKFSVSTHWVFNYNFKIRENTGSRQYMWIRISKIDVTVLEKPNNFIDCYSAGLMLTGYVKNKNGATSALQRFSDPWRINSGVNINTIPYKWHFSWQVYPGALRKVQFRTGNSYLSTTIKSGYSKPSDFDPWEEIKADFLSYGGQIWTDWNSGDGKAYTGSTIMKIYVRDMVLKST